MKVRSLMASMLACAALAGCSNDELVEDNGNGTLDGRDKAYLAIQLVNPAGAGSRATTGGEDGGFHYGTAEENEVKTAEFYFYNGDGTFNQKVSKALNWTEKTDNPAGSIEKIADATIVIDGLSDKSAPKYVIAVLNGGTLGGGDLTSTETVIGGIMTGNYFTMTNSTYKGAGQENTLDGYEYYATAIDESKFLEEAPNMDELTDENAVQIYVERLAAKVKLDVAEALANVKTDGGYSIGKYTVNGEEKDILIKISEWGLSGTNKTSNMMKTAPDWTATWNWLSGDYRSFWGESAVTYANADAKYPAKYSTADKEEGGALSSEYVLNYPSGSELIVPLGTAAYCAENTNTAEILETNFYNKVTHILVKAQTVGGEDLVRYNGQLYDETGFFNRVLGELNLKNYYKVISQEEGKTTYKSFSKEDLAIKDLGDGEIEIVMADEAEDKWFTGTINADNILENPTGVETSVLTAEVAKLNKADYYNQGMMYYNIPIAHLNGGTYTLNDDATFTVAEGDYGVVRNHYYNVTINKIENLGSAIYDPNEPIIVPAEEKTYYIGAKVNILSWKVVNQGVDL